MTYGDDISLDGHRCGIKASQGVTVKLNRFSLETFLGVGYQKLDLVDENWFTTKNSAIPYLEMKKTGKDLLINLKSNLRVDICAL